MSTNKRKSASIKPSLAEKKSKPSGSDEKKAKAVKKKSTGSLDELFDLLTDEQKDAALKEMYAEVCNSFMCLQSIFLIYFAIGYNSSR